MAENMDLKKMKIPELKKELTSRGLALKGNKQELVTRLAQYLEENEEAIFDNGTEPSDAILTPGVEEDGDLLAQEDEPSLLDDEEEETSMPAVVKVSSPVVLQRQPAVAAPKAEASVAAATTQKIAVTPPATTTLTSEQKKALRAQRFNTPLAEEAKKQARLEKFKGKPAVTASTEAVPKTALKSEALEKLKKRSERFGTSVSPVVKKTDEMDRLLKRQQRFGVITNTTAKTVTATGIRRISTDSIGDNTEAKRKRAERFGLSA